MGSDVRLPDRCLLYLLDRADVLEGDPRSQEVTQERVAEVVGAPRPHISRAMTRIRARGLVKTAKVHVRGEPRRRLAYFLTEEGLRRSKALRREVEETSVVVIDLEGRETKRKLYEVPALLPRRPRMSDLLPHVAHGRFDLRRFLEHQSRIKGGKVYDVTATAAPAHFRGRVAELRHLDEFLADPRSRGLLVLGLPGIGKTALVSRWVAGLQGRTHVLWRRLRPETTPEDLLRDLGGFLRATGLPALADHLQRPPEGGQNASRSLLATDLAKVSGILVFDDAHSIRVGLPQLLAEILQVDAPAGALKIVLISRERLPYIRSEQFARGSLEELELSDLPENDAGEMMEGLNVAPAKRKAILELCGGHPLSLELAAAGRLPLEGVRRTSVEWLAEEALDRLEPGTREALAFACVFGGPMPKEALGPEGRALIRRCLVREVDRGRVDTHELIRAAVLPSLGRERLNRLHVRAGALLSEIEGSAEVLHALEHYLAGRAIRAAADLALQHGDDVIDAGLAEPFLALLDRWSSVRGNSPVPARMRLLRGHALFALGRWADAIVAYEECQTSRDAWMIAEAGLGRGKAEVQRRSRLALPLLLDARDRLERLGALKRVAEAQYWIGGVHEDAGRQAEAQEAYERGRAVAFDVGDRRWEGLCTYGLGRLHSQRADYSRAATEELEALRLLERGGYRLDIAKVCAGLGGNLMELGRLEEAETFLMRATTEARMTGASGILASSLYNLASLKKERGRPLDAMPLLLEAFDAFHAQETYDRAAWCAAWLAFGAWASGDEMEGNQQSQRAVGLIEKTVEPALKARGLHQLGRACIEAGRIVEGRIYLERAISEARRARLTELESAIESELGVAA